MKKKWLLLITFSVITLKSATTITPPNFPQYPQDFTTLSTQKMSQISVGTYLGKPTIIGIYDQNIMTYNYTYYKDKTQSNKYNVWKTFSKKGLKGTLQKVEIGNGGGIWAITTDQKCWHYSSWQWNCIKGKLKNITIGSPKTVYGVGINNQLYLYSLSEKKWLPPDSKTNFQIAELSCGQNNELWCTDSKGNSFRYEQNMWGKKTKHCLFCISIEVKKISTGNKNNIIAAGMQTGKPMALYKWNNNWKTLGNANIKSLAIDPAGNIFFVDTSGLVHAFIKDRYIEYKMEKPKHDADTEKTETTATIQVANTAIQSATSAQNIADQTYKNTLQSFHRLTKTKQKPPLNPKNKYEQRLKNAKQFLTIAKSQIANANTLYNSANTKYLANQYDKAIQDYKTAQTNATSAKTNANSSAKLLQKITNECKQLAAKIGTA